MARPAHRNDAVMTRVQGGLGVAWGGGLLVAGRHWWQASTGQPPSPAARAALIVLGVRQLVEGSAQLAAPGRLRRIWLVVDLAHAASMALLAALRPEVRRPALISAGVATGSAVVTIVTGHER